MYEGLNALKFLPLSLLMFSFCFWSQEMPRMDSRNQTSSHPIFLLYFFVQYFQPGNILMLSLYFYLFFFFFLLILLLEDSRCHGFLFIQIRCVHYLACVSPRSVRNSRGWLKEEMMKGKKRERKIILSDSQRERVANTK